MTEISRTVRAALRKHTSALLAYPNVIGVGASRRVRQGRKSDEDCVVIYVSRKLPPDFLQPHERIPRELHIDDEIVPSDVVEIAEPLFLAVDTAQYRPLQGGCRIQTVGGQGTLGAILYDRLDHKPVLLTCNHVVTQTGSPTFIPSDSQVSQPAGGPWLATLNVLSRCSWRPWGPPATSSRRRWTRVSSPRYRMWRWTSVFWS